MRKGVPFLQVFPKMFQDNNFVETFKIKNSQRNKNIPAHAFDVKEQEITQFNIGSISFKTIS